ncbi:Nitrilase family, member 2 [Seminavis robusta]|uniref:Nitrilase family, member 2 n=1 Tax=Seminavis robusta TaxID=568900 RepID=A0A9N8HHU3_9STRA|nr:Nitrilase family, member 2 [Seminavis robusta]|eukprot:Sro658_g182810.1 Nitrilase family, member 2 (283) ;mRNA; f:52686-53534
MSSLSQHKPALADNFKPGHYDVVVGKGKKFYTHKGNVMLRDLVASMLGEYSKATSKAGKSDIISSVVKRINAIGNFVRREPAAGKWIYAEDRLCREKCSQTFRDALCDIYRSSSVAKKNRRRREQEEMSQESSSPLPMKKKMRLMEPSPVVPPIPSDFFNFETDLIFSAAPTGTGTSLPPPKEDNLVTVLSDLLNLPSVDEDSSNPFEPTPFMPSAKDIENSLALVADDIFNDNFFETTVAFSSNPENGEMDNFTTFGTTTNDFQSAQCRVVSPNFAAAYAA